MQTSNIVVGSDQGYALTTSGNWVSWVAFGLGHKRVGCIITNLSIYDLYKYKINIYYPPNRYNL